MGAYTDVQIWEDKLGSYITVEPPSIHWSQMGAPIVTCTSYAVGATGVREEPLSPTGRECQSLVVVDLIAAIARECSWTSDDDGHTEPAEAERVSALMDADDEALWAWAKALPQPPNTSTNSAFLLEGGLAVTTITTSAYAGWESPPTVSP